MVDIERARLAAALDQRQQEFYGGRYGSNLRVGLVEEAVEWQTRSRRRN